MKKAFVAVLILSCVEVGSGDIINVPADSATIQAGIDGAEPGDTVLVADGTYTGPGNADIGFSGKNIVLVSENGAENTIVDCNAGPSNAHWAFYLNSGEDSTAVIDGFTITNAFTDEDGAILLNESSPAVRNCIIKENDCTGIRIQGNDSHPVIAGCIIQSNSLHGIELSDVLFPMASLTMTNTVIYGNGLHGILMHSPANVIMTNCTFVANGQAGFMMEGDPPKAGDKADLTRVVSNCLSAYNQGAGFKRVFIDTPFSFSCNNAFGNDGGDYVYVAAYAGDANNNIAQPPVFCDRFASDFRIHESSPCAPANNTCGVLIGALGVGCSGYFCGDVNGNDVFAEIADWLVLQRYVPGLGFIEAPLMNSDLDLCGSVNMADLVLMTKYLSVGDPAPICEQQDPCYSPNEGNIVMLDCPVESALAFDDSIPLPILMTNTTSLMGLSLGFSYSSDYIHVSSIDTSGTILPSSWIVSINYPSDGEYVHPVADSNVFLITAWELDLKREVLLMEAQESGLLATVWFRIDPEAPVQFVDIDTAFVYPAGEFIFCPASGGAIIPDYIDCGATDLIIGEYICGDATFDSEVDIDDVVQMIACIFVDCLGTPLDILDIDCSDQFDIDDVVYLIQYIFTGGNPPCDPDGNGIDDC